MGKPVAPVRAPPCVLSAAGEAANHVRPDAISNTLTNMNHTDLHSIAFDTLPASSETQGIGIHKGIRYRRGKFVALDAEGLERNYRVTVSSLAKRAVKEDWLTDAGKAEKLRRA